MNLELLNKPLTVGNIDFKPKSLFKGRDGKVYCSILAYKDARVDMEILDGVAGKNFWQNKYKRDTGGALQCGIGILCDTPNAQNSNTQQWIWKWSNGVPSDFEAVKGEYSDAFKRAGFMWGIGRALYDFPKIIVDLHDGEWYEKDGKIFAAPKLQPNNWKWELSEDYQTINASQYVDGKYVSRFSKKPRS